MYIRDALKRDCWQCDEYNFTWLFRHSAPQWCRNSLFVSLINLFFTLPLSHLVPLTRGEKNFSFEWLVSSKAPASPKSVASRAFAILGADPSLKCRNCHEKAIQSRNNQHNYRREKRRVRDIEMQCGMMNEHRHLIKTSTARIKKRRIHMCQARARHNRLFICEQEEDWLRVDVDDVEWS